MSTATMTNGEILARHEISPDGIEHLDLEVAVLCGLQRQGDVTIVPVAAREGRGEPVGLKGVVVVRGESSGANAHVLHALDGEVFWCPAPDRSGLVQGWVTVPEGAAATLIHTQEHSVIAIGPGQYEARCKREFAGEWRRVAD